MKVQLEIGYKGSRTYLQGGDIFNALMQVAPTIGCDASTFVEQLIFRRFARNGCDVTTVCPEDAACIVGQISFRVPASDTSVMAWITESDRVVIERRPFDEAALLSKAKLDVATRRDCLPERSSYTPIEELIALTKQLNYAVCPLDKGQWLFGQLDLNEPLTAVYASMEIRMKTLLAGRFSVNEIYVDGRGIGAMRFIVGAP